MGKLLFCIFNLRMNGALNTIEDNLLWNKNDTVYFLVCLSNKNT